MQKLIARRVLLFAFLTTVLVAAPKAPAVRDMEFGRHDPCSTCGRATAGQIECSSGLTWNITEPGSVAERAAAVCYPGDTYIWRVTP